jgi:hypothetical protein
VIDGPYFLVVETPCTFLYILFTVHLNLFYLNFQLDTLFSSVYIQCLDSLCHSWHTKIGVTLHIYGPNTVLISTKLAEKASNFLSGGEYHWLHVEFRPPDDGAVRPETCKGKRKHRHCIYREENSVSSWK